MKLKPREVEIFQSQNSCHQAWLEILQSPSLGPGIHTTVMKWKLELEVKDED